MQFGNNTFDELMSALRTLSFFFSHRHDEKKNENTDENVFQRTIVLKLCIFFKLN